MRLWKAKNGHINRQKSKDIYKLKIKKTMNLETKESLKKKSILTW